MIDYFSFFGFTTQQYLWLIVGFFLFFAACYSYLKKNDRLALLLLTCAGASVFVFAALLDPFLNCWDERFHALAALNALDNPLEPKLFKEILIPENNYLFWTSAHVWLHKQPLFLWQIALSFKLFGVSEFTLRLPSVIMATALIPIGYRIASLLVDKKLGFYTAVSILFSWFLINLVSGSATADHNDVCFLFYISASVLAFMEYIRHDRKLIWILFAAFLSGAAVLTKWLVGLLLYFIWGVYLLVKYKFNFKQWKFSHLILSLLITIAVFLPWQIYILSHYHEMAIFEYQYNTKHLFNSIEDQPTNIFMHFKYIPYIYIGNKSWNPIQNKIGLLQIIHYIILFAGCCGLFSLIKKYTAKIVLLITVCFIYLFFTVSATKMPAFTFIISIFWFMCLGAILYYCQLWIEKLSLHSYVKITSLFVIISLFAFYQMNFQFFRNSHTDNKQYWRTLLKQDKEMYLRIAPTLPENCILFNVHGNPQYNYYNQNIEAMFYTGRDCYQLVPEKETIQHLKALHYPIAVFTHHTCPDYILQDSTIIKIDEKILSPL